MSISNVFPGDAAAGPRATEPRGGRRCSQGILLSPSASSSSLAPPSLQWLLPLPFSLQSPAASHFLQKPARTLQGRILGALPENPLPWSLRCLLSTARHSGLGALEDGLQFPLPGMCPSALISLRVRGRPFRGRVPTCSSTGFPHRPNPISP